VLPQATNESLAAYPGFVVYYVDSDVGQKTAGRHNVQLVLQMEQVICQRLHVIADVLQKNFHRLK